MCHPLENEIPVVGFSRVKYLEPLVGGENEVTVRQNVQVTSSDERYLKKNCWIFDHNKTCFKTVLTLIAAMCLQYQPQIGCFYDIKSGFRIWIWPCGGGVRGGWAKSCFVRRCGIRNKGSRQTLIFGGIVNWVCDFSEMVWQIRNKNLSTDCFKV